MLLGSAPFVSIITASSLGAEQAIPDAASADHPKSLEKYIVVDRFSVPIGTDIETLSRTPTRQAGSATLSFCDGLVSTGVFVCFDAQTTNIQRCHWALKGSWLGCARVGSFLVTRRAG
jgi:hypothetical protein